MVTHILLDGKQIGIKPGINLIKLPHAHIYSRMVQTRYVYVLKCDVKTSVLKVCKAGTGVGDRDILEI